jgi:hypothetical protein
LPPTYTVVYEIFEASGDDLRRAIKEGVVTPDMTRGDLDAWIAEKGGSAKEVENNDRIIATLKVTPDFDREKEGKLQQALDELKAQFGFAVQRPRDLDVDALTRAARKVDDEIRKGARLHIRKLKSAKLAAQRHLTPAIRKSVWKYDDEEIEIASDATWERVQGVLDKVGAGDQFQRLLDQALWIQGVSEATVREHRRVNHEEAMKELEEIIAQGRAAKHLRGGSTGKHYDFSDWK